MFASSFVEFVPFSFLERPRKRNVGEEEVMPRNSPPTNPRECNPSNAQIAAAASEAIADVTPLIIDDIPAASTMLIPREMIINATPVEFSIVKSLLW